MPTTAFQWRWITVASLLSFVVGIGFFCPRYVLWRGLDIPQARYNPEVHRAYYRLQHIEHPFDPIENENNRAMSWKLPFPLVAHYLHLPRKVLFTLPFISCLLALGLTTYVVLREGGSTLLALLSSMLAATTSWFFVSTGWLSYFDSWYILGLLCVSFIRNKTTLVVYYPLVIWIDELFILGLPLALIVRTVVFRWVEDGKVAQLFRETGLRVSSSRPTCSFAWHCSFSRKTPIRQGTLQTIMTCYSSTTKHILAVCGTGCGRVGSRYSRVFYWSVGIAGLNLKSPVRLSSSLPYLLTAF